jgi:hypothetical protein
MEDLHGTVEIVVYKVVPRVCNGATCKHTTVKKKKQLLKYEKDPCWFITHTFKKNANNIKLNHDAGSIGYKSG